jgi:hypothetical protein
MFCILWEANGPQLKDTGYFSGDPDMKNSGAIVWGLHLAVAPNPFLRERIVTGIRWWLSENRNAGISALLARG